MYTFERLKFVWMCALCALCIPVSLAAEPDLSPGLGKPATAADLGALPLTVFPDGRGLPTGSGSVTEGEVLYRQHCLACHGQNGRDGINDTLAGGHKSLTSSQPLRTVGSYWPYATTLFDYIKRAMPYRTPGSLSNNQIYALSAYLLHLNGIVEAEASLDANRLSQIRMPNRDNFTWAVNDGETP